MTTVQSRIVMLLFLIFPLLSCNREQEQTTTSGTLNVVSDEAVGKMTDLQIADFMRSWDQAKITNESARTRIAVEKLLNKETDFIVISRELKPDEQAAAKKEGLELVSRPLAMDALCFIVHPKNPVTKITLKQAKEIYSGKIKNWNELGGPNLPIRLFATSPNDGQRDYLIDSLLRGEALDTTAYPAKYATDVLDYVSQFEGALGYTSTALARPALNVRALDTSKFKVMALAKNDSSAFIKPFQQNIYDREYPLWYFVYYYYMYYGRLARGLSAYVSKEGQKILERNGLTPFQQHITVVNFTEEQ
ncbi:MAG: substrate-binding domain-containing protein [Chloroherpetonaceae bacterium]|nr:substrate-binding domain-containing protein [Chloroherpetonaceae bacterium]